MTRLKTTTTGNKGVSADLISAGSRLVQSHRAMRQAEVAFEAYVNAQADTPTGAVAARLNELLADVSEARADAAIAAEELTRIDAALRAERQPRRRKPTKRQLAIELAERNHKKAHEALNADLARRNRRLLGLDAVTEPKRLR